MSDLTTIRAAIKTAFESVTGIGTVHDYERFATRKSEFTALFASGGKINGLFFTRTRSQELDGDTGLVRRLHEWSGYWFYGLDDANASEKTFQALIELACTAFRADPTLGGDIDDNKNMAQPFGEVGLQVDAVENVMFHDVLCHRARLRLITETTESK